MEFFPIKILVLSHVKLVIYLVVVTLGPVRVMGAGVLVVSLYAIEVSGI